MVLAKADDHYSVLLREDGLIHCIAAVQMRKQITHAAAAAAAAAAAGAGALLFRLLTWPLTA